MNNNRQSIKQMLPELIKVLGLVCLTVFIAHPAVMGRTGLFGGALVLMLPMSQIVVKAVAGPKPSKVVDLLISLPVWLLIVFALHLLGRFYQLPA